MLYSNIFTLPIDQGYESTNSNDGYEYSLGLDNDNPLTFSREENLLNITKFTSCASLTKAKINDYIKLSSIVSDSWKSHLSLLRYDTSYKILQELHMNSSFDLAEYFKDQRQCLIQHNQRDKSRSCFIHKINTGDNGDFSHIVGKKLVFDK